MGVTFGGNAKGSSAVCHIGVPLSLSLSSIARNLIRASRLGENFASEVADFALVPVLRHDAHLRTDTAYRRTCSTSADVSHSCRHACPMRRFGSHARTLSSTGSVMHMWNTERLTALVEPHLRVGLPHCKTWTDLRFFSRRLVV